MRRSPDQCVYCNHQQSDERTKHVTEPHDETKFSFSDSMNDLFHASGWEVEHLVLYSTSYVDMFDNGWHLCLKPVPNRVTERGLDALKSVLSEPAGRDPDRPPHESAG